MRDQDADCVAKPCCTSRCCNFFCDTRTGEDFGYPQRRENKARSRSYYLWFAGTSTTCSLTTFWFWCLLPAAPPVCRKGFEFLTYKEGFDFDFGFGFLVDFFHSRSRSYYLWFYYLFFNYML